MNHPLRTQCSVIFGLTIILTMLTPSPAEAAGYMKIAGVEGESTDKGHKNEIEILSWSLGATQAATAKTATPATAAPATARATTGAGTADPTPAQVGRKRQYNPITFTKRVDKSSPMLQKANTDQQVFPKVTLYLPNQGGGGQGYLTYELKEALISSYQTSAGQGEDGPTETISFVYGTLRQIE